MKKVIFLDIDGVLNAHEYDTLAESCLIRPNCVRNFNRVLRRTGASIVISSSWRYMIHKNATTLKGFEYLLRTHGVHCVDKVIGTTPLDEEIAERGDQISCWINLNQFQGRYVVLDDGGKDRETGVWTDLGIQAAGHPVVMTMPGVGLTSEDATRAINILNAKGDK